MFHVEQKSNLFHVEQGSRRNRSGKVPGRRDFSQRVATLGRATALHALQHVGGWRPKTSISNCLLPVVALENSRLSCFSGFNIGESGDLHVSGAPPWSIRSGVGLPTPVLCGLPPVLVGLFLCWAARPSADLLTLCWFVRPSAGFLALMRVATVEFRQTQPRRSCGIQGLLCR
jgi:hypothetical protein